MYLSIGSSCNVCREDFRAIIEEYNDDGTGRRTFATGIRNAVGMTLHNGRLWATNNGSDWEGNDIPPEWIGVVRDGANLWPPLRLCRRNLFRFQRTRRIPRAASADRKRQRTCTLNEATGSSCSGTLGADGNPIFESILPTTVSNRCICSISRLLEPHNPDRIQTRIFKIQKR